MVWAASCIGFSGFFLRAPSWRLVAPRFSQFACLDHLRDQADMTLAVYLQQVEYQLRRMPPPYLLVGHSFGAYLARLVAQRLQPESVRLVLLAGLCAGRDQSALEAYQASGQRLLAEFCRLDFSSGQIALQARRRFVELLFAPQRPAHGCAVAAHEPVALIMDHCAAAPLYCESYYLVCAEDRVASLTAQQDFASSLHARRLDCAGGHMAPLRSPDWLSGVCHDWPLSPTASK